MEVRAAWHFLTLPQDVADEIEDMPVSRGGFGSLRVDVTIGSSIWGTSIFPSKELGSFLLPLKKPVTMQKKRRRTNPLLTNDIETGGCRASRFAFRLFTAR